MGKVKPLLCGVSWRCVEIEWETFLLCESAVRQCSLCLLHLLEGVLDQAGRQEQSVVAKGVVRRLVH